MSPYPKIRNIHEESPRGFRTGNCPGQKVGVVFWQLLLWAVGIPSCCCNRRQKVALLKSARVFSSERFPHFSWWKPVFVLFSCFVTVIPLFCPEQALDWRIPRGMADSRGLVSLKSLHDEFTAWSFLDSRDPKCLAVFWLGFFFLNLKFYFYFELSWTLDLSQCTVVWHWHINLWNCAAAAQRGENQLGKPHPQALQKINSPNLLWCHPSGLDFSASALALPINWWPLIFK